MQRSSPAFACALVVSAVTANGGIVTTLNCNAVNTTPPCTSGTTYSDFAPATSLTERINGVDLTPFGLPAFSAISEAETMDITIFTSGPERTGYLDLSIGGTADGGGSNGFSGGYSWYSRGSVVGVFSWSCFAAGCSSSSNNLVLPVTLGVPIEVVLSTGNMAGRSDFGFIDGFGEAGFTLQIQDGSPTGRFVTIFSAPEPRYEIFAGLCVLAGLLLRRLVPDA